MQVPLTETDFTLDGFKQLARHIKKNWPEHLCAISLSQVQDLLSRCLGYKDYHNAKRSSAGVVSCNQLAFDDFIPAFNGEVLDFLHKNCESKFIYHESIRVKVTAWPIDNLTAFMSHDGTWNYQVIFDFIKQDFKCAFVHGINSDTDKTPADSASRLLVANDVNGLLQSSFGFGDTLNMFMEKDRLAGSTVIMDRLREFAGTTALQLLENKKDNLEFSEYLSSAGFELMDNNAFVKGVTGCAWEYVIGDIANYAVRDLFENDLNECGFYGLNGEVNITPDRAANLKKTNYGFSKLSVIEDKRNNGKIDVLTWDFRLYNNSGQLACYASGLIFRNQHPLTVGEVELLEAAEIHGEVTRLNIESFISEISKDHFNDSVEEVLEESNLVLLKEWERQIDSNIGVGRKCIDLATQEICEKFRKKVTVAAVMRLPNYKYWAGDPPEVVIYDALDAVEKVGIALSQVFQGDNNSVRHCYEVLPDLIGNDPGIF